LEPETSSLVEVALAPTPPMTGTVKIASLFGLVTDSVAVRHPDAEAPAAQLSRGANAIVMTQDCRG
jgi:hypothetical protein